MTGFTTQPCQEQLHEQLCRSQQTEWVEGTEHLDKCALSCGAAIETYSTAQSLMLID